MKVPMRVDYGVRALLELAKHQGQVPLQTSTIASRQAIPRAYLDRVLTTLHKSGIIRSRPGPQGGHLLAKDPGEIDLGMVWDSLEGRSPLLDCLVEPSECIHSYACAQREVWSSFEEAVHQLLRRTNIGDMARQQDCLADKQAVHQT